MEKRANKTFSDNPFLNLMINVLLPVIILKKGTQFFPQVPPLAILAVAISLPLGMGLWDYLKAGHKNYVSILGVLNISLTGGFALMEFEGFWFALKEGVLPLLIGIFVVLSLKHKQNFIEKFFLQPQLMDVDLINKQAISLQRVASIKAITQKGTLLFSASFLVSALLNLTLGMYVFAPISLELPQPERAQLLNDQIAQMTWLGYVVIALPLTLGTGLLIWWLLKKLSQTLELTVEDLLKKS